MIYLAQPQGAGADGAGSAVAFDLTAACSGFLFSPTAAQYLRTGAMTRRW